MTTTVHLPSPSGPLCGRVLSRDAALSHRDQSTMQLGAAWATQAKAQAAGFAAQSAKPQKTCRHCMRVAGLLPPLGRRGYAPGEAELALTDDELLEALEEEEAEE